MTTVTINGVTIVVPDAVADELAVTIGYQRRWYKKSDGNGKDGCVILPATKNQSMAGNRAMADINRTFLAHSIWKNGRVLVQEEHTNDYPIGTICDGSSCLKNCA